MAMKPSRETVQRIQPNSKIYGSSVEKKPILSAVSLMRCNDDGQHKKPINCAE
jgi:hypothetical protein